MGNPDDHLPLLDMQWLINCIHMIYRELLSQTSQQFITDVANRKQHYDSLTSLLHVIPPELQALQRNISDVLHFVPTIKNAVLRLQQHNDSQSFSFPLSQI